MSRNAIIGGIVIILVVVLGWYYLQSQKGGYTQPQTTPPSNVTQPEESPATPSASAEKNVVNITSSGFLPKDITVKAGESVTWANEDTDDHTVNSVVHPTHLVYPPLNLGVIKEGDQKSLTFPTAGTYKYHDHLNPTFTGSVTVQ